MNRLVIRNDFHFIIGEDFLSRVSLIAGLSFLSGIAFILLTAASLFLAGFPINAAPIVTGTVVCILIVIVLTRRYFDGPVLYIQLGIIAVLALLVLGSFEYAGSFYDSSYDGLAYHQEAVIQLVKNSWNPFYESLSNKDTSAAVWLNHFAKGPWIYEAALYQVTDNIEYSKMFNLLFAISAFFLSFSLLVQFEKIGRPGALILGLCAALNPIAVIQSSSFYVDGYMASAITAFTAAGVLYFRTRDRALLPFIGAAILVICNVKFTGVLYAGVLTIGLWAGLCVSDMKIHYRLALYAAAAAIVSILFVGFNPYVTNTLEHSNPLYPAIGSNKMDIVSYQMVQFKGTPDDRFSKFIKSVFSSPETGEYKIPFTMTRKELKISAGTTSSLLSGFGPLSSGIILVTVILIVASCVKLFFSNRTLCYQYLLLVATLLISIFMNPECWNARYIPQLWLVSIISIIGFVYSFKIKFVPVVCTMLVAANIALMTVRSIQINSDMTRTMETIIATIQRSPRPVQVYWGVGPFRALRVRFQKHSIGYIEMKSVADLTYPKKIDFFSVVIAYH